MLLPRLIQNWNSNNNQGDSPGSFDYSFGHNTEIILWRLDLIESLSPIEQTMEQIERQMSLSEYELNKIPAKVAALAQNYKNGSDSISFHLSEAPLPEKELFSLLDAYRTDNRGLTFDSSPGSVLSGWKEALNYFESSFSKLNQMITKLAVVETSISNRLIGSTVVNWAGDFRTLWSINNDLNNINLHSRSLKVALASRRLFINMLSVSAVSAVQLSTLLAIPGGPIFALPAVWKYVSLILNSLEKYPNLTDKEISNDERI